MSSTETHPVKVSVDTWQKLSARKRPGDSFDDVIQRLIAGED